MYKLGFLAVLSFGISACVTDGQDGAAGAAGAAGADGAAGQTGAPGPAQALPGVYTLANAAGPNQVATYLRASNGNLSREGRFTTGGVGLGAALGSQGSLMFDAKSQRFFAVNAGDNTISMLAIDSDGNLSTLSMVPSGGKRPVSITVHGNMVYVVNQGDLTATAVNANISGFQIQGNSLVAVANSTRALSGTTDVHPTDIAFSPDGKFLVVVERFASKLDTFAVVGGAAQAGSFQASAGLQPFAFDWSPEGYLVVAEVGTGGATASSVSSYSISAAGALVPVTSALPTGQAAACWLVMAGGYAYVANAASANITGINVSETGVLTLHDASGITAVTGSGATDLAVSPDRGYLYSLSGNPRTIGTFAIHADGSLTGMAPLPGVSATASGLAAR
jgi:6-phosphogluconolactonase (cycloisomerase 2 family)